MSHIVYTCLSDTVLFLQVIKAGATTLNIPDTVGYTVPAEYGGLFKYLIANTEGSGDVVWSTHCHNDLGLATPNTLDAIHNGARQVEVLNFLFLISW